MRHLPPTGGSLCSLAAVSSAAIPVRVKLKTPLRNAAVATTLDIPTGWDLQQRRPRPVADAGRSCWGSGQQDASAAQGTRGCWEPQLGALNNSPPDCCLPPAGGRAVRFLVRVKTAATTVDIPGRWDPRANQSPTGALVAVLRTAALFDSRTGQIKNPPSECSRDFYDPYGNRTHVTAVKGPCLNRLTNGPYKYRASLKPPTFIIHYCGRPSPLS